MSENKYRLPYTAQQVDGAIGNALNSVLYTKQPLNPEQQEQVRANIGAVSQEVVGDIKNALYSIIAIQNELIIGSN